MEPHDVPPPPYTETDIFSQSARSPGGRNSFHDDDASIAASSSRSNIIYTPPETPRESHHNFGGSDEYQTTASAQAYFEARPTSRRAPRQNLVISLAITSDATPEQFPYPGWATERETTEQDWQTFVNYLLPDHASRANSHIIDRKLRAEAGGAPSSPSGRDLTGAQLDRLEKSALGASDDASVDVETTIREWNDGFFEPRGVTIRRAPSTAASPRMPGSWDGAPAAPVLSTRDADAQPQSQAQPQAGRSRWNPFGVMEATGRGLRIGSLHIDGDRVAIGNAFQADRNGVRWNGQPVGQADHRGMDMGRGHRWEDDDFDEGGRGRGRGWGRGRGHGRGHGRGGLRRDHSASSNTSTSSSSSSSDSESSIGSLPDWDDLKDTQLPVTKQSITSWLSHPEQPVTRDMVKSAKADIKAAKKAPRATQQHQPSREEIRELLAQFENLKRQQKGGRKAMRREKRAEKRALRHGRRTQRHAERREHRANGRELRCAEREVGRHARHHHGGRSHDPAGGPAPFVNGPGLFGGAGRQHAAHSPAPGLHPPPGMHAAHSSGPDAVFGPGRSGGPGFFGGRGGPFARGGRGGWEQRAHDAVARARETADRSGAAARAHAAENVVRSQAVAAEAVARSQEQSQRATARGQAHADRAVARAHAQSAQAAARGQAHGAQAAARGQAQAAQAVARGQAEAEQAVARSQAQAAQAVARSQAQADRAVAHAAAQYGSPYMPSLPYPTKYDTANALEAQIATKAQSLSALQAQIAREQIAAAQRGEGDSKAASGELTEVQGEAEALEKEIERLGRDVEGLRLEADEEFARRLEREGR
ncbi:Uu.00g101250.m01.CDS01 [Anthostomella pinea]|uniref:Uu.00g101250.m01.CDS01 n=1 Tax=Anthostomella pinea TaxID=933095 RepID=A0AAI8VD40_9PEZI|nr:Uu.00g101250.m01.CDS01 [Anthostomella pinea]